MDEDASLDDFLGDEPSEQSGAVDTDSDSTTDAESADETGDTEPDAADDIEPAKTTYAWSDEGSECGACGETVERRWQQDGGLVCVDCKDWERA